MTDFANLGIKVQTGQVKAGGAALDTLGRRAGAAERKIDRFTKNSTRGFNRLGAAVVAALAGFGVARVTRNIVAVGSRFEDMRSVLAQATGSLEAASAEMQRISDISATSVTSFQEMGRALVLLRGNGINPTTRELRAMADAAANTTVPDDVLRNLAIFRQRLSQGAVSLEDLERVADRGLPVYRILNEQLGLTRLELRQLNNEVGGTDRLWSALITGFERAFGGSNQSRLNNMSTLLSNFGDAVAKSADVFNQGLAPAIKNAISQVNDFINRHPEQIRALGELTGAALQGMVNAVGVIAANSTAFGYLAAAIGGLLTIGVGRWALRGAAAQFTALGSAARGAADGVRAATGVMGRNVGTLRQNFALGAREAAAFGASARGSAIGVTALGTATANTARNAAFRGGFLAGQLGTMARAIPLLGNPVTLAATAFAGLGLAVKSVIDAHGDDGVSFWDAMQTNISTLGSAIGDAAKAGVTFVAEWTGVAWILERVANAVSAIGQGAGLGLDFATYLSLGGRNAIGHRPGEWWQDYLRRHQRMGGAAMLASADARQTTTPEEAAAILGISGASAARVMPRHRGTSRRDLVMAMRLANAGATDGGAGLDRELPNQDPRLMGPGGDLERYRERQKQIRDFRRSVDFEFSHALSELVTSTERGSVAIKDMVRNLGNDLEARVLDHAIGKPFRDLMSTILEQIYDALTSRAPWGANGNFFSWITAGGAGAGRAAGVGPLAGSIPSLHGGGFTGRGMRSGGIDGRGGFPAILHPNESVIDHEKGGFGGVKIVINNNAPEVEVTATTSDDGRQTELSIDRAVAGALANGTQSRRVLRNGFGLDPIAGA